MPTGERGGPSLRFRVGFRILGAVTAGAGAMYIAFGISGSGAGEARSGLLTGFGVACLVLGGFVLWWSRR